MMAGSKRKMPDDTAERDGALGTDPQSQTAPTAINGPNSSVPNPGLARPHRSAPGMSADGHFRRLYDLEPNFKQLAKQDARFAAL